jgi:glycine cleavage system H protein
LAGASKIPENLRYTKDHEWVELKGNRVRVGITDHAQDALTDVVFVELPEVGEKFAEHDSMGVVESVKSVNDIFAPVAGTIVAVNDALDDSPELMNQDPYGKGWFCEIELVEPAAAAHAKLMDAAAYRKLLESGH